MLKTVRGGGELSHGVVLMNDTGYWTVKVVINEAKVLTKTTHFDT